MAHSSLLGIEPLIPPAPGHDESALGPGDSSDSGSDMAGVDTSDRADPLRPLDRAWADALDGPLGGPPGSVGSDTAADISVDRVFRPVGPDEVDDPEAPLASDVADDAGQTPAEQDEEDEEDEEDEAAEDESADPVGDGRADAALAASLPQPGRPNPEPDPP